MRSSIPIHNISVRNSRAYRHPRRQRFRRTDDVRFHTPVLNPEPASSPPHPSLHLIINHQDPILIQQLSQPVEVLWRRNHVSTLSLNRLDEHRRDILRWKVLVQNLFLDKIDTVHITLRISHLERASVTISKGNMGVARNHWEEVPTLDGLARRESQ